MFIRLSSHHSWEEALVAPLKNNVALWKRRITAIALCTLGLLVTLLTLGVGFMLVKRVYKIYAGQEIPENAKELASKPITAQSPSLQQGRFNVMVGNPFSAFRPYSVHTPVTVQGTRS